MAECSYARCIQERRFIKKELQKWNKDMVHIVGEYTTHIKPTQILIVSKGHFFRLLTFELQWPISVREPISIISEFFSGIL